MNPKLLDILACPLCKSPLRYDKPAAERHWERLFSLFRRNLG